MLQQLQKIVLLTLITLMINACDGPANNPTQVLADSELAFTLTQEQLNNDANISSIKDASIAKLSLYRINYHTTDAFDAPTIASAALIIPEGLNKNLPLLSIQHGTMFIRDEVVSQRGFDTIGKLAASMGYVTLIPDYLGFGINTGFHPYHHLKSSGQNIIDAVRAARQFCEQKKIKLNTQLFLAGYSEGGYVTMAAQQMMERNFPEEFNITATAPMAGAYDLKLSASYLTQQADYAYPAFLAYVLNGFSLIYDDVILADIVKADHLPLFETYFDGEHSGAEINSQIPHELNNFFNEPNSQQALLSRLHENNAYYFKPIAPMQLVHCIHDEVVPYFNSKIAYEYFLMQGASNVGLVTLDKGGHGDCAIPAATETALWFNSLVE